MRVDEEGMWLKESQEGMRREGIGRDSVGDSTYCT